MKYTISLLAIFALLIQSGCETSNPTTPDDQNNQGQSFSLVVARQQTAWGEVTIYAHDTLRAGYAELLITVKHNGQYVQISNLQFEPEMAMQGGMTHSTPIDTLFWDAQLRGYQVHLVWVMATYSPVGDKMGDWTVHLSGIVGQGTLDLTLPIEVYYAERVKAFISALDSAKIIAALHIPNPEVGLNDFDLFVYQKVMHHFEPMMDLSIEIEPEMPSMGHGSPNNQNPVHIRKGRYQGKVNFTMTGDWVIHTTFYRDSIRIGKVDFPVTF